MLESITNLFDENYLHMNYRDLLQECQKIQLKIQDAEIQLIERETFNQARLSGKSFLLAQSRKDWSFSK